jgi:hypothetical protein
MVLTLSAAIVTHTARAAAASPWTAPITVTAVIAAAGVLVAGWGVLVAARAAGKSMATSAALAAIEQERRKAERTPRLSARLALWGPGSTDLVLAVWLDSTEPLSRLRVVIREARNLDCPVGFKRGQEGVANELPSDLAVEGIRPAWSTDVLAPIAEWRARLAPGDAAVWAMALRPQAQDVGGGGADLVRFKVLTWPDGDSSGPGWELPVPVTITPRATVMIGRGDNTAGPA